MGNMSYCRFENTSNDLRDCVRTLEEAGDFEELDLSGSEVNAAKYMLKLCERYIEAYGDLQQRADSFSEESEDIE